MKKLTDTIFVFGSNRQGIHGAGSAKTALERYGAKLGVGEGLQGASYAIPTKSTPYKSLTLDEIAQHVEKFKEFAKSRSHLKFKLTPIGCGLAGFTPDQIGPMFAGSPSNVIIPEEFQEYIIND
jgi:hypothetical protein